MEEQHKQNNVEEMSRTNKPDHDRRDKYDKPKLTALGVGLAFMFAAAAFFSGLQIGSGAELEASIGSFFTSTRASEDTVDLSAFWRVWNLLDSKFVSSTTTEPITDEEKVFGAISGLVDAYDDPYTVFLPPDDAEIFESDITGNFGGVGMEVGMRDGVITIIAPLPGTPAKAAGVESGDVIVRIDGESTERMGVDGAVKRIRGEKGTEVVLTLFREGVDEFLEISIVRDTINIPTIETEERDGVFIIRLFNFSAISEALVQSALRDFVISRDDKLIIDVRSNPGGFLQSAVNIASYFLPTGKVVVKENFGENEDERLYRSTGRNVGRAGSFDMVVLINGGSASASEILAGALQEHGVATLIGTPTFGKGSVQELVNIPGGSSLKVTIAKWLTPNGNSISDGGLTPDIEIELTLEDREAERDPQLDAAIEFLNREK